MLLRNAKTLYLPADHLQRCREKCCGVGGCGIAITDWKLNQNAWRGQEFPKNNTHLTSWNTYQLFHLVSFIIVYYVPQILSTWIKISECFYFQIIVFLRCVVQGHLYTLLTSRIYIRPQVVTERLQWYTENWNTNKVNLMFVGPCIILIAE